MHKPDSNLKTTGNRSARKTIQRRIGRMYGRLILDRPAITLVVVSLLTFVVGSFARDFSLDASADSLVLERDAGLRYYRYVRARFGSDDYLIITYTPQHMLFSTNALRDLGSLRDALAGLPNVAEVTSILDVPLLNSPATDARSVTAGIRYLRDPETNPELARQELLGSPLYRNLIISADGATTALRVDMRQDQGYLSLRDRRDVLRQQQYSGGLSNIENNELSELTRKLETYRQRLIRQQQRDIAMVRATLDRHRHDASLHLGGVPMIIADSMDYIRHDLVVFGSSVLVFLVGILAIAFRKLRWIVLPLLTCASTCVLMLGILGLTSSQVTIVSSNFIPLLLILCLALTLHIIVRYRETHERHPTADQRKLVDETVSKIALPCFYTALTTIVAFGSLLVSGIRPVIDFGWMMSVGVLVAFVYSFTIFPASLVLLRPGTPASRNDRTAAITQFFASLIQRRGKSIIVVFLLLSLAGVGGVTKLTVENRFIDYYRQSTEIYQGMELIDRKLGGTTPLDVIIDAPASFLQPGEETADADDLEDLYAEELDIEAGLTSRSYWFNRSKLGQVSAIHDFLEDLPATGKVVSLATIVRVLQQVDPEISEDNMALSLVYQRLEPEVRDELFAPYLSEDGNQLRYSVRVFESDPSLRRAVLLERVRAGLVDRFGINEEQIHLTGMLVLYNNMLQSLFQSQIVTLGAVFLAIVIMFLLLFRSLKIAMTAIIPNIASATLVLGFMGWFGIPLDLMTITIAAITVGIGVDDTIHYVHRFEREFAVDRNYWAAVTRCHRNIGRAIYYTSVTIMLGFSILAFSQFIPTIYFGLLTSLAMLIALLANMTLLPLLMVAFKTGGKTKADFAT